MTTDLLAELRSRIAEAAKARRSAAVWAEAKGRGIQGLGRFAQDRAERADAAARELAAFLAANSDELCAELDRRLRKPWWRRLLP